jgi:predicted ester cyclase
MGEVQMQKIFLAGTLVFLLCFSFSDLHGEEVVREGTSYKQVPSGLKDAHDAFFKGILAEDTVILDKLLSDDVTLRFPGGGEMPRATFLSLLKSGELFYDTGEHEAVKFRIYENTAVVTGRSNLAYRYKEYEGFERLAYTATYVKTDGEWELVAWQSTDRDSIVELEKMKALAEVEEQNIATVRHLLEEMDKGNFDIWDEVTSSDYVYYFPSTSEPLTREDHKETNRSFYTAFPDLYHSVEDIFAKGDKVIVRVTNRFTHSGEFMGIPPTGKKIAFSAMSVCQFKDGKIIKEWLEGDMLGLMQQLGMELKPKEE